jgi:hypothetical protein
MTDLTLFLAGDVMTGRGIDLILAGRPAGTSFQATGFSIDNQQAEEVHDAIESLPNFQRPMRGGVQIL